MKKDLLVAIIVLVLLLSVIGASVYLANYAISPNQIAARGEYGNKLIIQNQIAEVISFAEQIVKNTIAQALLHDRCFLSRADSKWQSNYASFQIGGHPQQTDLYDPHSKSGCFVKITFGQGKRKIISSDLKDKTLFLYLTNGGTFIVSSSRSSLDKKYWPH